MDAQGNNPVVDSPKYKLWQGLKDKKLYTKEYPEFEKQFSTDTAISGLHDALQQRKLYTKGKEDFATQFFPEKTIKTKEGKVEIAKEDKSMSMASMPKLANQELFDTNVVPIVDKVYNKNTANIVNNEKLTALLPKVKEQKVKDLTISTLLSQGKLAMEGGNSYKDMYNKINSTIKDEDWMPSWTPTSAKVQFSPEVEKQKTDAVSRFSDNYGETPEEINSKLKNGDYEYDYKNNKILTKGGFGDMAAVGLNNFFDKWRLFVDAGAAQERGQQKGNDNELKYVINQYEELKKNQRQFIPHGESDIAKWAIGQGQTFGELGPYVLAGPAGVSGAVMGIQTAGGALEDIINQPGTLDEKVLRIKHQMVDQTMLGFAQDAAFKLIHINDRNSAKELMAQYGPTKKLFNTFKEVMRVAPSDAVKAGLVGVGQHVIDNLYKKNDGMKVEWDIPEAFKSGATLDLMMKSGSVLTHGFSVIKNALKFNLDKSNPEWFNRYSHDTQEILNHIVSSPNNVYEKVVEMLDQHPSEEAKLAKDKIEAFRNHYNSLPKELSKSSKFDALHLLQMKTEALAEAGSAADVTLQKALMNKASKIDELLQQVVNGGEIDKKEPLLLPRFAQSYNRDDEEARGHGFKDAQDFVESINRREATDYKKFSEIPEDVKSKFVSELVPKEQPKIDTTVPEWFVTGETKVVDGKNKQVGEGAHWSDIEKSFPELVRFAKMNTSFNRKSGSMLKKSGIKEGDFLTVRKARDLVLLTSSSMPYSSEDLALQVKAAEQAEMFLSYFKDELDTMTKDEVKAILEKPGYTGKDKFTPEEIEIMKGMIDRLKVDKLFDYAPDAPSGENYYQFANNVLKSKEPKAFVHEIGHWAYYNVLSPEDRLEFLRFAANRFGTKVGGRAAELAMAGAQEGKIRSDVTGERHLGWNTLDDFQEYFADQFRQYYFNNVLPEPKMRSLYEKIKEYVNDIIKLFKERKYNPELTKYFDKIIDVSKPEGEGVPIGKEAGSKMFYVDNKQVSAEKFAKTTGMENINKATPEDLQAEFQKIKDKYDARTTTEGITEVPTRPTSGVSLEPEPKTKPFRTIEPTEGQFSAFDEWARTKYASEGELDVDYGRSGLSKYGQTREEFLRSRFCK